MCGTNGKNLPDFDRYFLLILCDCDIHQISLFFFIGQRIWYHSKGASTYYVPQFFEIFDPPLPLSSILLNKLI